MSQGKFQLTHPLNSVRKSTSNKVRTARPKVTLMLGQTLGGRYRIVKQIGKGGFGVTFVAEDTQRPGNPLCVVKQFKPIVSHRNTLREAQRLFNNEAETLENLGKHDQIPRLLAHFQENQEFYLVQEYIEGHDLSQEMPPNKQFSEAFVIQLLQDILEVLAFVHQHGVIHRDIKPSNIRRRQSDGKIVLIDFGSVKQITTQVVNSQGETNFTIAIGTPGYMPSEQANSNPQLSSDIYAVGIIGIQALSGISPVQLPKDFNTHEIIWRNQVQVNQELADILDKMVRYDFRQRYQSSESALQALTTLISHGTTKGQNQITVIPSPSPSTPTTPLPPPPWKLLLGTGIATVLATSTATWYMFNPSTKPTENFSFYENYSLGIKIKYPQTWELQNINNPITGEVVAFLSPKQSYSDKFPEKITISVEDFSGTLDEFSNSSIQDINNHMTEAKIVNKSSTTLSQKPASQLVFTGKDEGNRLKNLQVFTLKADKAYVITYTAEIDNYDDFIQTAASMIKSFEIH